MFRSLKMFRKEYIKGTFFVTNSVVVSIRLRRPVQPIQPNTTTVGLTKSPVTKH